MINHRSLINLILIVTLLPLLMWSCKEKTPTEEKDTPKGTFVQKIAFIQWDTEGKYSLGPMLSVADLYNDQGIFRLYNTKKLKEGTIPDLSKDESWIAYVSDVNGLFLRRINADGTNDREIPMGNNNLSVLEARISSDEKNIALTVGNLGYKSIGIVPVNGGTYKEVYNDDGSATSPEWSKDLKKLYFSWIDWSNKFKHNVEPFAKAYIASVNTDGTGMKYISDVTGGQSDDNHPRLSPDGKTIAFTSLRSHPGMIFPEVFTMDTDGQNIKKITTADVSAKHGDHYDYYNMDEGVQWVNDGEHLIVERMSTKYDHDNNKFIDTRDLFIVSKDGTGLQNLTNNKVSTLIKK